jgi:hypothetical protein
MMTKELGDEPGMVEVTFELPPTVGGEVGCGGRRFQRLVGIG